MIGAHLHTGSSTTNGPVAVIFCGVDPLPDMNGPCTVSNVNDIYDDRYLADWESQTVDPDVAFTSGGTYMLHIIVLTMFYWNTEHSHHPAIINFTILPFHWEYYGIVSIPNSK